MEERLREILNGMDVPVLRIENFNVSNLRWLSRNLRINNNHHPHINEAMEIIIRLLRKLR